MPLSVIKKYIILILLPLSLLSQVTMPAILSDGVILQRDSQVKIWGQAAAAEQVSVEFLGKVYTTQANDQGNWQVFLNGLKAGGPFTMSIRAGNQVHINDILVGDVWFCSGQSNMTIPMERVKEKYPDEIARADYPAIRQFFIPTLTDLQGPRYDLPPGQWKTATAEHIMDFSAVAYFFAREIYDKYKIPVGIINSAVGGTPIRSWISEDGLKDFPQLLQTVQQNKDSTYIARVTAPRPSVYNREAEDRGLLEDPKWYDPAHQPKGWYDINIPGYWEDQGLKDLNGTVWYRREIELPESMKGAPAKLFMGRIIDADFVYVNGKQVGNITYQYPPRRYEIPGDLLLAGKNTIVVRVTNYNGKGGFVPDKPYYLTAAGQDIDLKGTWQYKVGEIIEPRPFRGWPFSKQNQPAALFNAMVAPLTNHTVKGFLWYQGESDTYNGRAYYKLLPALINDWRHWWNNDKLGFFYVQLADFGDIDFLPTESGTAEVRDAQLNTLSVPHTGMAVTIDLGEWNDIHPLNKKDVGIRLALAAMNKTYADKETVYSGPIYKKQVINGNKITVYFDHVHGGLVSSDGGPLQRFEIAGHDGRYVRAEARIKGNTVEVNSDQIERPASVRYAWADSPKGANLYNKAGLPASPFRTLNPDTLDMQPWQGKKAAVVLTYDDAVKEHLDHAIPVLDSLNLKATFYVTPFYDGFKTRIKEWQTIAKNGHELGNHTLFHPCDASRPGREWVDDNYDMSRYTVKRMTDEIKAANILLQAVDGQKQRTFAFTCGDMQVADTLFMDLLQEDFTAARAVRAEMHTIDQIDLYDMDCYMINGESGRQLTDLVKKAVENKALLVFLFHGVGGGHSLNVSLQAHSELLHYLKQHDDQIWTGTMLQVAGNIRKQQQK